MNKKIVFIFGVIFGVLVVKSADKAHKLFENKKKEREIFVDKKQKLQEDGFCYCQDIQERDKIDFDFLTKKTIRNIELGQSFVDIFAVQDIDIQKKVMKEIFNKVKNIKPENNSNIYVTSDIHGDILMLLRGLLKSGLVSWNGEMKIPRLITLCLTFAVTTVWAQQPVRVEYFLDTDPGFGLATPVSGTFWYNFVAFTA